MKSSLDFDIKYKLYRLAERLYCLEIASPYDLGMTFLRYQEYYESPNKDVRGQIYDIDEYMRWYSTKNKTRSIQRGVFSYVADFAGYNIPSTALTDILVENRYKGRLSIYDEFMKHNVYEVICNDMKTNDTFYLIGTDKMKSDVLRHEAAHGFYYINPEYKNTMDSLIKKHIPKDTIKEFKEILKGYHYHADVMIDEIQSFVSSDEKRNDFPKVEQQQLFVDVLNEHLKGVKPVLLKNQ